MDIQNKNQWKECFNHACQEGCVENIRHLCQKKYFDLGWADVHGNNEGGFRWACYEGHMEVVKYLLTSKELSEAGHSFADLHSRCEGGLRLACEEGHLEIMKYLLTSPELIEAGHSFADVHANNEDCFMMAVFDEEHWNVLDWLIMDYGIERNEKIEKIMKDYEKDKGLPQQENQVRILFEKRAAKNEEMELQSVLNAREEVKKIKRM